MKYYIEFENEKVVAIHSAKPVDVDTLEIDESELQKYLTKKRSKNDEQKL